MTQAEEVPKGAQNAGFIRIVVRDLQQAFAVVVALGEPEMGDARGTVDIGQNPGFAGIDGPRVAVAARRIPRGETAGPFRLHPRQSA